MFLSAKNGFVRPNIAKGTILFNYVPVHFKYFTNFCGGVVI